MTQTELKIAELEKIRDKLKSEIADSNMELQKHIGEKNAVSATLSDYQNKISDAKEEISKNEWKLRGIDADIEELRLKIKARDVRKAAETISAKSVTKKVKSPAEMDPLEFEEFCAEWLKIHGYQNIDLTKASGDFGVDILCEKDLEMYACQCKHWQNPVGAVELQKLGGGMRYYGCEKGIFFTINGYTLNAISMAERCDIELINFD